jgi:hypothetical protein
LHDTLFKLPGVTHLRSSIVLKEVKKDIGLPINSALTDAPLGRRLR